MSIDKRRLGALQKFNNRNTNPLRRKKASNSALMEKGSSLKGPR